jgi:hypothetical protein
MIEEMSGHNFEKLLKIRENIGYKRAIKDIQLIYTIKTGSLIDSRCEISLPKVLENKIKMECYLEVTRELLKLSNKEI